MNPSRRWLFVAASVAALFAAVPASAQPYPSRPVTMKLLPGARFDDGVLDLIDAGGVSRLNVLLGILPKLYSGAHVHHPKVRTARGTSFRFDSGDVETLVDLDGEMVGRLPLEVTVLPQAFRVGTV